VDGEVDMPWVRRRLLGGRRAGGENGEERGSG